MHPFEESLRWTHSLRIILHEDAILPQSSDVFEALEHLLIIETN